MEYAVISASSADKLADGVNKRIAAGWQPTGGIAITQQLCDATKHYLNNASTLYDAGLIFVQAMIRSPVEKV